MIGRTLRAYPTLLRVGFAGVVAYRAEMLVWILSTTMPLVSLALWSALAENGPIGRFDKKTFIVYFLSTLVVRQLTSCWLVWELNHEIRTGVLSQKLLKPMHPLIVYSADNLAAIPMRALACSPIAVLAISKLDPDKGVADPKMLFLFFLSVLGAWLINFFTMTLVGSLAFVLENSTGIFDVYLALFFVFSGYLVPIELFPDGVRAVVELLPFRYTLAFPVEISLGMVPEGRIARAFLMQWSYVVAISLCATLAFRRGVRRFSAFGG